MGMPRQSTVLYVLGTVLLLLNVSTSLLNYLNRRIQQPPLRSYSFKDTDYPAYYPITLPAAVVSPEDSVHYSLWENATAKELGTMFPDGGGFLYLGPDKRPFGVALYHQMHCMSRLESAYFDHTPTGHTHHCFNYIRQAIMCEANPTLEPVSPSTGKTDPRTPRVCKDWSVVRDLITQNHIKVWEDDEIWW